MSSVNGNRYPDNEPNKDMTKPIFINSQKTRKTKKRNKNCNDTQNKYRKKRTITT